MAQTIDDIIKVTDAHVLKTYNRFPVAFERGEGTTLYDLEGAPFLDFTAGIGVNALGYGHPAVTAKIGEIAGAVLHTSNLYHIPSQSLLAEKICGTCFGERVFFCNSGAEAVESALKFARKRGKGINPGKTGIVAFAQSFHGRTFGALSATRQEKYRAPFEPLLEPVTEAPLNDIAAAEQAVTAATCAVIVEPVQGEGGVRIADDAFLQALERLCLEHDALLIVDEVQCGMGRTGTLFAHEHAGIKPDIMTLAKPLAGGLPIGAAVLGPRAWPSVAPGDHASTFGGNQFVTGVACTVFDILSDAEFLASVRSTSDHLFARLAELAGKHDAVTEIRGRGLLAGIVVDFPAIEAVNYFMENGVLICPAGAQVIRFIPPLVATVEDCDRAVDLLDRYLTEREA
jgi:acetylornithine/N-succinyldiaminopimelate aminotransferase